MEKLKNSDKITVYYFGDVNNTSYECRHTTYGTLKKWRIERNAKSRDIAFYLKGYHPKLKSYELEKYLQENNLKKYA